MARRIKITHADISAVTGVLSLPEGKRQPIMGISTDSRKVQPGDIFFALVGEKFDAHQFVSQVIAAGAAIVVVNYGWAAQHRRELSGNAAIMAVPDTTKALGELARIYRRKFSIPFVAVGGSNGKTTTKEMIVSVLKRKFKVLSTEGNLNNHIGVPQTLFSLRTDHEIAVIEVGTNHFGELGYISSLVEPTHAVVTNIGREHLEFFGDEDGVALEELQLFNRVAERGYAFINADDARIVRGTKSLKKSVTFGTTRKATVRAKNPQCSANGYPMFQVVHKGKRPLSIQMQIAGMHNVLNALAAVTIGIHFRISPEEIKKGLESFTPASKRMEMAVRNGITILNDTYNANPDSVLASLETLKTLEVPGKKIIVLADMLELGSRAVQEHRNIGERIGQMGFSHLYTFGPLALSINQGSQLMSAKHFEKKEILISELKKLVKSGDAVLVKGSRGMKMEEVSAQL